MIYPWRISTGRRLIILYNFIFLVFWIIVINTKNIFRLPYKMFDINEEGYLAPVAVLSEKENITLLTVSRVVDGDTIVLENGEIVRYIGIDSPEYDKNSDNCFIAAKNRNEDLVLGKKVGLVKDVSEKDIYGRLLRYVYIDSVFINEVLVKDGFARRSTYPPDIKYEDLFLQAENFARENRLGLWGECR